MTANQGNGLSNQLLVSVSWVGWAENTVYQHLNLIGLAEDGVCALGSLLILLQDQFP